jgi:hypothetical protein
MTIHFTKRDARVMRLALQSADVEDTPGNLGRLADAVQAAFRQQLEYEANYLAADMAGQQCGSIVLTPPPRRNKRRVRRVRRAQA